MYACMHKEEFTQVYGMHTIKEYVDRQAPLSFGGEEDGISLVGCTNTAALFIKNVYLTL